MVEITLWATRVGEPDWKEDIITSTTDSEHLAKARAWAEANGFDRLREVEFRIEDARNWARR